MGLKDNRIVDPPEGNWCIEKVVMIGRFINHYLKVCIIKEKGSKGYRLTDFGHH